jgi:hypothetical protein
MGATPNARGNQSLHLGLEIWSLGQSFECRPPSNFYVKIL